jgi:integrase
LLRDLAYPLLGTRPIKDISAPELLAMLRTVEGRGRYETAAKLRQTCGSVFRYAIATSRAERDPSGDLRGALARPPVQHRAALLTEDALAEFLRAARAYEGKGITAFALKLAPLVFLRPGELRHGEWKEINFTKAEWRIPAARMKAREEHIVPLARQAVEILKALHPITGRGPYIFPSLRSNRRPMSEGTILAALRRMGYAKDEVSGHGFRRTASTFLNEMGFNRDWIERQLAHREGNEVRGAYNAAHYLAERRVMMQRWADHLDQLAEQCAFTRSTSDQTLSVE